MDEPFGALDAITRSRLQDELLGIQRGVRKTILFVSHDVEEALKLGDQIVVMSEGKLVQQGTPIELLARPANDFVRRLIGGESILRQFEYLPVTWAVEPLVGQPGGSVAAEETLLTALLRLIESGQPSLRVERDGQTLGQVSLNSISRRIIGADQGAPESASAPAGMAR
jgi:osmoprotectant transport system ATP-binding protein